MYKRQPYTPGRPNSGGPHLKYKFVETASFIVAKVNDKRSISLILFDGEKVRPAGNVTIPPNHDIPSPGAVVECRFLYAFKESGSIYPVSYTHLDVYKRQLLFSPSAHAGWFSSKPDPLLVMQIKIDGLENKLAAQHQSLNRWQLATGSLAIGLSLIHI